MSRSPSINGCILKIRRSTRYVDEANSLIDAFAREIENRIAKSYNPDTQKYGVLDFPVIPEDLPLAISDAVHNLRTALDYLVYELALKDSGTIQHGTQFPICDTKASFDGIVDRYLKGVSQPHRDKIGDLQPYKGVEWSQTLRDMSNPDKHRELVPISKLVTVLGWHGVRDGKVLPTGKTIKIDASQTILISLPQGTRPIVVTLHTLQANIVDTINLFSAEF